jgi:hypothetical protein
MRKTKRERAARTFFALVRSVFLILIGFMTLTLLFFETGRVQVLTGLLPLELRGNLLEGCCKHLRKFSRRRKLRAFGSSAVMAFSGFRPVALRRRLSASLPFRAYFSFKGAWKVTKNAFRVSSSERRHRQNISSSAARRSWPFQALDP